MDAESATIQPMSDNLKFRIRSSGKKLAEVAEAMGVDKSSVTRWTQNRVPAERVLEMERITGIPRHELRPDIFGGVAA